MTVAIKRYVLILTLFMPFLLIQGNASAHPFYVSIIEIDHNPETRALEITMKIFTDDLENTLAKYTDDKLRIGEPDEHAKTDEYIEAYIAKKFTVKVNGERVKATFIGKEIEEDATWCYVEVTNVSMINLIEVSDWMLLESFEDQSNMVHLRINGEKRTIVLRNGHEEDSVRFL